MTVLRILLEVTIYSNLLFLVILLFRAVFKKHASPAMLYAAWLLLAARLLVPVTVGGVSLIVLPAQEAVQLQQSGPSALAEDFNGEASTSPRMPAAGAEEPAEAEPAVIKAGIQPEGAAAVPWEWDWNTALITLWIAGAAVVLLNMAAAKAMLYKRFATAPCLPYKWRQAAQRIQNELGIRSRVRLAAVWKFDSPALSASLRPTIIIPMELLCQNSQSIEFALRHELTHLKRKDHLVCLLLTLLKAIYWFNPAVWLAARLMKMDMETACDSRVVSAMDDSKKKQYASTILNMYAQAKPRFLLGMALGHTRQTAERRIRGIFMRRRSARVTKAAALLLAAVMLVACFTTALQPVRAAGPGNMHIESPERSLEEIAPPAESPAPKPVPAPDPGVSGETEGDYLYFVTGGNATITGYTGGGDITIPSVLGGYPVTAIGDSAFYDNKSITGVTIPEGVKVIKYAAFDSAVNLETVSLPGSLVSIEGAAFFGTGLTSVYIPVNVTAIGIEEFGAFGNCSDLTEINVDPGNSAYSSVGGALFNKDHTEILQYPIAKDGKSYSIPSGVTAVGAYAFRNSTLKSVVIPGGAREIGDGAFWGCQSLESADIPGSVTKIGHEAFVSCSNLQEIYIPAGTRSIGTAALAGCTSLTSIDVDASNGYYASEGGVLFDKGKTTLLQYPAGKSGISYTTPDTVTVIEENSFSGSFLKSIIIPDGVTSIRYRAFEFCRDLISIEIPDSVKNMDFAFEACDNLAEVIFLGDCPATTEYEFYDCSDSLKIYYAAGKTGYTSPWHGYDLAAIDPAKMQMLTNDATTPPGEAIVFKDPIVEKVIRTSLNKPEGPLTDQDMLKVWNFKFEYPDNETLGGTIKTIDDLRWCVNLRRVILFDTDITDISALSGTRDLVEFQCQKKLNDLTPLLGNKNLSTITLIGTTDSFFRELMMNCSKLNVVNLYRTDISSETIRMLADRFKLSTLRLIRCGITDVSPVADFTSLEYLSLEGNNIKDISPLAGNPNLSREFDLGDNNITDWSPLENMLSLITLYVDRNPVTESPALDKLEEKGCYIYR